MPAVDVDPAAPLSIVLNAGSGRDAVTARRDTIESVLAAAGRAYTLRLVEHAGELASIAAGAVAEARARGGVVVVGGGDGTINAVAQATYGSGRPLGVLPQGTFNYFSRAHGIPADTAEATRLLLTARAHPVQVGQVNGRLFLVNASLGLYPQLLEDREAYKRQFGRSRPVAFASALVTLLREHRQLRLDIEHAGQTRGLRTPTLFVGNNPLQLQQVGVGDASALAEHQLVAVALRPVGTWTLFGLVVRGAFGNLGSADTVMSFPFGRIVVTPRRGVRRLKVATDGEVVWLDTPITFEVAPEPLHLLRPEPGIGAEETA